MQDVDGVADEAKERLERMKGDHSLLRSERYAKVYTKMAGFKMLCLKVLYYYDR